MTTSGDSEAKAREIVEAHFDGNPMDTGFRNPVSAITSVLDEAVRGEREACAVIAEERSARLPHDSDFSRGYAAGRAHAATAIRSRNGEDQ